LSKRWRQHLRFWGPDVDADVDDELRYHLDMRVQFYREQGLSAADARRAALDGFGDVGELTRQLRGHDRRVLRRHRRRDMFQDLSYDLRHALRQLRATPRFTAAVVLVLALGIGANTAIFSAVDAAFFRPLPFPHADRLVSVANVNLPFEASQGRPQTSAELDDFRADSSVFAEVAAYASGGLNLIGGAAAERVTITYVTSRFFATLQRPATFGRLPVPEEFAKGGPRAVVISYALWQREFGGDLGVVRRTVGLNSEDYHVVGVMPEDFGFPGRTDVWIPLALPFSFDIMPAFRNYVPSFTVARLAPGVTVAQAAEHADAIRRRFPVATPGRNGQRPIAKLVVPLQTSLVGDRRTGLLILAASAALLLLIACANVTNLLLSRAAARQRDIAIRAVLGATRVRIVRQLVVESLLLAGAGAASAIVVARLALGGLASTLPPSLAQIAPPELDWRVLAFTLVVAVATSLLVGTVPALGVSRPDLAEAMKTAGAGGGGTRRRASGTRGLLVIAEVSLAMMLLVASGLMLESLDALLRTDSGMRVEHVVTGRMVFSGARYFSAQSTAAFFDAVFARLRASPGVDNAAAVTSLPMEGVRGISIRIFPEDAPQDTTRAAPARYLMASPGYFATLGIPLRGQDLPAHADTSRKVAVINATMARTLWPGEDAIGRRIVFLTGPRTVVGVVGDVRTDRLDEPADGQMYFPISEQAQSYASLIVRGEGDPSALLARLRDAVHAVDPAEPLYALQPMSDVIATTVAPRRTNSILLTVFGVLAVALAAVGVFAVLSYGVAQRTREIGVRVALGAQRGDVIGLVARQGFTLAIVGIVIGMAGALALSRFLAAVLYQVSPHDPRVFVAAPILLGLVAMAATLAPAIKATGVDPLTALREE
jgi:putative ABC transport system permease protein